MKKVRILSAIKPTGKMHLGNYFGAIQQFLKRQNGQKENECLYFIADYHALTALPKKEDLSQDSRNIAVDYLTLGLDPKMSSLFLQSSIIEHCELSWILSNSTPLGLLNRAHAFKDKVNKGESINGGLLYYPILMAADILIYDSNIVPVGKDQKQHVEIARDIAIKFNNVYGNVFTIPETEIVQDVKSVIGMDGQKMSKSYNNTIEIFEEEQSLKKKIMSIPTDSKGINEAKDPNKCILFNLSLPFLKDREIEDLKLSYSKGIGYKDLKDNLFQRINSFISPLRAKRAQISQDDHLINKTLKDGREKAHKIAAETMKRVRKAVGLIGSKYF